MVPDVAMKALVEEAVVMEMVQQAEITCTMLLILGELNSPISGCEETALDTARPSDIIASSPKSQPDMTKVMHACWCKLCHVHPCCQSHHISQHNPHSCGERFDGMVAGRRMRMMTRSMRTMRERTRKRRVMKPPRATLETRTVQVGILFHVTASVVQVCSRASQKGLSSWPTCSWPST